MGGIKYTAEIIQFSLLSEINMTMSNLSSVVKIGLETMVGVER